MEGLRPWAWGLSTQVLILLFLLLSVTSGKLFNLSGCLFCFKKGANDTCLIVFARLCIKGLELSGMQ